MIMWSFIIAYLCGCILFFLTTNLLLKIAKANAPKFKENSLSPVAYILCVIFYPITILSLIVLHILYKWSGKTIEDLRKEVEKD